MTDVRRACLIYVTATQGDRASVCAQLEQGGYIVCEVKADLDDALAARAGEEVLPADLAACVQSADLCVFLLPEDEKADGLIGPASVEAHAGKKRMIGVIAGTREKYPEALDEFADAMIRSGSSELRAAIGGKQVHEAPNGGPAPKRDARNVRCQ